MVLCSFSLLAQRKEPKESAPVSHGPSDCLALLEAAGILKTRFAQTVQNPFSAASEMLKQVPMGI